MQNFALVFVDCFDLFLWGGYAKPFTHKTRLGGIIGEVFLVGGSTVKEARSQIPHSKVITNLFERILKPLRVGVPKACNDKELFSLQLASQILSNGQKVAEPIKEELMLGAHIVPVNRRGNDPGVKGEEFLYERNKVVIAVCMVIVKGADRIRIKIKEIGI